jgi:hypothetical protein
MVTIIIQVKTKELLISVLVEVVTPEGVMLAAVADTYRQLVSTKMIILWLPMK